METRSYWQNVWQVLKLVPSFSLGARIVCRLAKGDPFFPHKEKGMALGYNLWKDGTSYRGRIVPKAAIQATPRVLTALPPERVSEDLRITEPFVYTRTNERSNISLPRVTVRGLWLAFGLIIRPTKLTATLSDLESQYVPPEKIEDMAEEIVRLSTQLHAREIDAQRLQKEVESGRKVVDFMQQITQMIAQDAPDDVFVHNLCEILYTVAGVGRCIAFFYNEEKDALVAEEKEGQAKPWASKDPENTREIEAFTRERDHAMLSVPLTAEGQAELGKRMLARATRLAMDPSNPPGASVARRILFGLPGMALTGKMVAPKPTLLSREEQPLWDRLGLEPEYHRLNIEAVSRGWNRYYEGEGASLTLVFSKDIVVNRKVTRVVLKRLKVAELNWERSGIEEATRTALTTGEYPEVVRRLLDIQTMQDFLTATTEVADLPLYPVEIEGETITLAAAEWNEIFAFSESILSRVFKQGRTLVVNDTSRPEHPISKILTRMWGSRTFIATPIKVFALVPDEAHGGYKMEERIIGIFGLDHDQSPQRITEETKNRIELLVRIAGIGLTLRSYTRALESALGKHLGQKVTREIINKMLAGRQTELAPQATPDCSVMFTDIVGFTGISAQLTAPELTAFLTEYRNWMDRFIFKHEGILDKYVGDAHLAAWGTLVAKHTDDAQRALKAAIEMQKAVTQFTRETQWEGLFQQRGIRQLSIRIGIDTGEVMAGVIASGFRHEYTVLGEPVNRANRFEGAAGTSGILISESTFRALGPDFVAQYTREFNATIREWLIEDHFSDSSLAAAWRDISAEELFQRKEIEIKIGGKMQRVVAYQVKWDRKQEKEDFELQRIPTSPHLPA